MNQKIIKNKCLIGLILIALLMPYSILFQDNANPIVLLLGVLYLLIFIKEFRVDKKYFYFLIAITVVATISLIFTNSITQSLQGLTVYIGALIFYLILEDSKQEKATIINWITYAIAISTLFYIILQGAILKGGTLANRIDGNIGYANTYALLLLIGIYFNELREKNFLGEIIEIILIIGIIFTGSRNTLFYLIVYMLLKVIIHWKEKDNRFLHILNFFVAVIVYGLIENGGVAVILILPIAMIVLNSILKAIPMKVKNILSIILVFVSIPAIFISNTTLAQRLKGTSLQSNELQQRLYYFLDAIKHIIKQPLGSGINSFQYRQVLDQSAWYDIRYIHNSVLQVGYDIGLLGMVLFIFLAIYGSGLIFKSKDKDRLLYLALYVTVFLHSLLDFDFAYIITFILLIITLSFTSDSKERINIRKAKLFIGLPVLIFSLFISLVGGLYFIGDKQVSSGNYLGAINTYKIGEKIINLDSDIHLKIALAYDYQYRKTGDKIGMLTRAIDSFKTAEKINPINPLIIANLALGYQAMGDEENTIYYYDKLIKDEKYNYDAYKAYYDYLAGKLNNTKDGKYKDKISELQKIYKDNISKISPSVSKYFGVMPGEIKD